MDELLEELRCITADTAHNLDNLSVDQLEEFVERRETIVQRLRQISLTEEDRNQYRELVEHILALDPFIMSQLERYKDEAGRELAKMKMAKQQRNRYESDRADIGDGLFFDKRK